MGTLLREAREAAGLTQAEVAAALGFKQQYDISLIENRKRMLDPIELENFARLYGKRLNDFATLCDGQPTTEELRQRAKEELKKFVKRKAAAQKERRKRYLDALAAKITSGNS